ncbi:Down syndrome cell adhesion molecule-like protein Dscam2 [Nymphon striatum]|nr:Down syndrome cell adhesion molecule-like protein Dscam2 [Nymphon striatum]
MIAKEMFLKVHVPPCHFFISMTSIRHACESKDEDTGPLFLQKFPASLNFLNSVGGRLDCSVYGKPYPEVTVDFVANDYRAQIYDDYVVEGNTAILECQIPSFVVDYVRVTSWFADDHEIIAHHSFPVGRYSVFPSGHLHIRNITMEDVQIRYRCQTTHILSGKSVISESTGQVYVTARKSSVLPRITHSEIKVTTAGPSVQLPCAAQAQPVPTHSSWFKEINGTRKLLVQRPKYQLFGGTLLISSINLSDSGIYVCEVNNSMGSRSTKTELIVTETLGTFMNSTVQMADVGGKTNFTCHTTGGPLQDGIQWYHNGKELDFESGKYSLSGGGEIITIPSVARDDSGMYQCIIRNFKDTAQATGRLELGDVAPMIISGFTRRHLQPGPSINLNCEVSGDPVPDISWYLDGSLISNTERTVIRTRVNTNIEAHSDLTIHKIRSEDGGLYQCIATNKAGQAKHSERINVYGVPSVRQMGNVTVVAGEKFSLRCPVYGYPIHTMVWQKEGKTIFAEGNRRNVTPEGELVVNSADQTLDSGSYTCVASNRQGQRSSQNVWIHVLVKPKLSKIYVSKVIKQGAEVNIFCNIEEGDPPFTFTWFKDGQTVLMQDGLAVQQASSYSILSIRDANQKFNGMYICTARNKAGIAEQNFTVTVQGGPKWVKQITNTSSIEGDTAIFTCQAKGSPQPTITWKRITGIIKVTLKNDDKYEIKDYGELHIKDTQIYDAGQYACEAKNGVLAPITANAFLNVGGPYVLFIPPSILSTNEMRNISVESSITLICDVRGDLPLVIEWRKLADTSYFTNNERFEESQKRQPRRLESSLLIEEIEETDDGTFICEASNNYGQDMISIRLVVQGNHIMFQVRNTDPYLYTLQYSRMKDKRERNVTIYVQNLIVWKFQNLNEIQETELDENCKNVPDPPKQLIILSLINGSLEMSWKLPESNGKSEIFYYLLEYKKDGDIWKNASKQKIYANDLNRASISVEDGFSYTLRMFSVNAIGKSDQSTELFFTVIENGTVIVANNIGSDLASSASPSLKALIPWLTTSLAVIISLLGVIVIVFFVVRKKSNPGNRRPSTSQESAKILISTTLRRKQAERDRYGKVLPSMEEDEFKRQELYSNAPKYIYSPSNDFCKPDLEYILFNFPDSEIDISPYATFQLPQAGSIRKSTTELKTFCRFPDVKEREFMTQKTPNNILKNIFPSASNDCNAFTISKLNIVVIVSKLLKFSPSDYHKELYKRFILLNAVNYEYRNICIKLMMAFKLYIYLYPEMVPYYYYSIIIHTHAWEDIWKICPPQWTQDEAKSAIKVYGSSNRLGFLPSADSLLSMISSSSNPSKSINIIDEDLFACIKNGKVVLIIENGLKQPSKMGQISSNMIGCYKCDVTPIIKWLSINGAATQIRSASDNLTLCCASVTELMGIFVNYTSCQPNLACLCARTGLSIYFCGQPMHDFNRGSDVIDAARDVIDAARDVIDAARDVIDAARDVIDAVRDVIPVACLGKLNIAVVVFAFDSDVSTSRLSWQLL